MTDVKRLLDEATPLPWTAMGGEVVYGDSETTGMAADCFGETQAEVEGNAALIVYAVNRLPDYEAAVSALHLLERTADRAIVRLDWDKVSRKERVDRLLELDIAAENARAALARLREHQKVLG